LKNKRCEDSREEDEEWFEDKPLMQMISMLRRGS
jgi:hypothetical protein